VGHWGTTSAERVLFLRPDGPITQSQPTKQQTNLLIKVHCASKLFAMDVRIVKVAWIVTIYTPTSAG
jgi:hypothetical protein